jgi:hypothetical protein
MTMTGDLFRQVNDHIRELGPTSFHEFDFVCECDHENCKHAMQLTETEYDAVREDPDQFAVLPGHELRRDEVVHSTDRYVLVKKTGALVAG